jgi:Na+/H+ antiporter NhaC
MEQNNNTELSGLVEVTLNKMEEIVENMTNTNLDSHEKDHESLETLKKNLNAMFLIIMGAIIVFMQAGFGFLEAGSIRAKNTTNILIKNFADLTFGNKYVIFLQLYGYIPILIFIKIYLISYKP